MRDVRADPVAPSLLRVELPENARFTFEVLDSTLPVLSHPRGKLDAQGVQVREMGPGETFYVEARVGKRVIFSPPFSRLLISSHVLTQFPLIVLDERSPPVEFSKSGHFP